MTRIAAAAYPVDWFDDWRNFEEKLGGWVARAAGEGADLLVFPEYGAMELSSLAGTEVAGDLIRSIAAIGDLIPRIDALHAELAAGHKVHICAASAPVRDGRNQVVNRARLFTPSGKAGFQDKLIMTRFEREEWTIAGGHGLTLFATPVGRIGILICYDAEFPLFARALVEAGAEILLVPSSTDTLAGYRRVRIAAKARALEGQCIIAHAPLVGEAAWSPAIDVNRGAVAIFAPPDHGFPETGVLAEGVLDQPGWVIADVDLDKIAQVRRDGQVLNVHHWPEQQARLADVETVTLG